MRKGRLRLLKGLKHKKKLLQKTEELIGNIIVEKFVKPKPCLVENKVMLKK